MLDDEEDQIEATARMSSQVEDSFSMLNPPAAFSKLIDQVPDISSPGNIAQQQLDREGCIENRPFRGRLKIQLGHFSRELKEEGGSVYEGRAGCGLNRVAFKKQVLSIEQSYGTPSVLETGLKRPVMLKFLGQLDE